MLVQWAADHIEAHTTVTILFYPPDHRFLVFFMGIIHAQIAGVCWAWFHSGFEPVKIPLRKQHEENNFTVVAYFSAVQLAEKRLQTMGFLPFDL